MEGEGVRCLGCGFCEGQADRDGVGPHGIRCLVKVAFVSVHVGQTGRIVDGGIGGGLWGQKMGLIWLTKFGRWLRTSLWGAVGLFHFF